MFPATLSWLLTDLMNTDPFETTVCKNKV